MPDYATFAADLAAHPDVPARVLAPRPDGGAAGLGLTPCAGHAFDSHLPQAASAPRCSPAPRQADRAGG